MLVIALISSKGGTGKSTLATNLAVAAHLRGVKTAILDIDPQGSSCEWSDDREDPEPLVDMCNIPRLRKSIDSLRERGFGLCIVDTPGELTGNMLEGVDFALLPTDDSYFAQKGTAQSLRFLTGRLPYAICMNKIHHSANVERLHEPLIQVGIQVTPPIRSRQEYKNAPTLGQGVLEYAPKSQAAAEINALYDWIEKNVNP